MMFNGSLYWSSRQHNPVSCSEWWRDFGLQGKTFHSCLHFLLLGKLISHLLWLCHYSSQGESICVRHNVEPLHLHLTKVLAPKYLTASAHFCAACLLVCLRKKQQNRGMWGSVEENPPFSLCDTNTTHIHRADAEDLSVNKQPGEFNSQKSCRNHSTLMCRK